MDLKDTATIADIGFKIVGIGGGVLAALKILYEMRESRKQKVKDLQWKQANAAHDVMKEIHANKYAAAAITMLDWFVIESGEDFDKTKADKVTYEEVLAAIPKISNKSYDSKERYILDCFDWFFYYIDRTEQYIRDGLFPFDNVKYIFFPYYQKITKDIALYQKFMKERSYLLAPDFWERYKKEGYFQKVMKEVVDHR